MNKIFIFLLCTPLLIFSSCTEEEKKAYDLDSDLEEIIKSRSYTGELDFYRMPQSYDYANLPNQDPKNPVTAEKAALGKFLFFETGIGMSAKKSESMATYSCSSCLFLK
ncbi:MAG: hypothetical protein IPL63_02530 [Saprospiraceae bacterium]|nr:hypothetical protein [Saprospiraceae bacterium]MBK8546286.1 hypothetical protein [Saprospiraceae bacterium]MBK8854319.1 hypothetical protein [Saprospiraceae bacterium]